MLPETEQKEMSAGTPTQPAAQKAPNPNAKPQPERISVPAVGTLRVKFSKTGMLRYISHLDLLRTMQTAMMRARIPVWYTEGFNPHQKLVFALPLSLGTESVCELIDIKVTERIDPKKAAEELNRAFPPDMRALDAWYAETKFTGIFWARYEIRPVEDGAPADLSALDRPEIITTIRTKSGEKEIDLRPKIHDFAPLLGGGVAVTLRAAINDIINPDAVARVLGMGEHRNLRTAVFCEDGETEFR